LVNAFFAQRPQGFIVDLKRLGPPKALREDGLPALTDFKPAQG
jgi:hypothetical protein